MSGARFPFSNFEQIQGGIDYAGVNYPTSEHAYQAAKFQDRSARLRIAELPTPSLAKRRGQLAQLPEDWDTRKVDVMADILAIKFSREPFRTRLMTHSGALVEWNTWHDNEWGDCTCGEARCVRVGRNLLGVLLTQIRSCMVNGG